MRTLGSFPLWVYVLPPLRSLRIRLVRFSPLYSCLSVNIPRCVARYLDLSSWSITCGFLLGDSSLFIRILASCRTSEVTCLRWSRKYSMELICTPNILYYLFGGRCRMGESSSNFIALIWLRSRWVFLYSLDFRIRIVLLRPRILSFLVLVQCIC